MVNLGWIMSQYCEFSQVSIEKWSSNKETQVSMSAGVGKTRLTSLLSRGSDCNGLRLVEINYVLAVLDSHGAAVATGLQTQWRWIG